MTKNFTLHRRPFFNTPEFFDKTIYLITKSYDNHYTPSIKINKKRSYDYLHSDFEIIIKISVPELRTYNNILVTENRFIKDDVNNLKYFPDPNTIKIGEIFGNKVIDVERISPYEKDAIEKNKIEFDNFIIEDTKL